MAAVRSSIVVLALANLLPAFVAEPPSRQSAAQASDPAGLELLHEMQSALGGAKAILAVTDFEETIRADAWDANGTSLGEVRKRTRWIRNPGNLRLDQRGPRGTYVLYFDGGSGTGWEILPDTQGPDPFKTAGVVTELAGGELQFAKGYLSGFELTLWQADQIAGYRVTTPGPYVVRIEHGENATDLTLDPATKLPAKSASVSLADPNRPVPAEMRYDGWKEVSGVRFPIHRVNFHSGVKRGEVTTEDIRVNAGLRKEDLAAKPADFTPQIKITNSAR
jgi:hypothetical protein